MKRILLALSTIAALATGSVVAANAVELNVGPGGVDVGPGYHHHHYYDSDGDCRVIITHHTNRWGNDVTVRRRVCD